MYTEIYLIIKYKGYNDNLCHSSGYTNLDTPGFQLLKYAASEDTIEDF